MSSDPSSKSAAKNGRRFDLRHMKFSVFNTDWVTNERGSISSRSRDHFKLRTCTKTRSRNVPFWCMNWAKSCTRWGHAHTSYNFPFFFAGFFCFSFFFSCFFFLLKNLLWNFPEVSLFKQSRVQRAFTILLRIQYILKFVLRTVISSQHAQR